MDADDGYFDERVAARYDETSVDMFDPAVVNPVIDLLVEIAGSGRALELGIGTGRIALPLAQRRVPVHGIELSNAMVARLRAKPGGEDIRVTIGDFATTTVDGTFSVAYMVFNTIMNLTTQAAQVACFRNVAAHLEWMSRMPRIAQLLASSAPLYAAPLSTQSSAGRPRRRIAAWSTFWPARRVSLPIQQPWTRRRL
jgi:SAM-dependent methyltransferase